MKSIVKIFNLILLSVMLISLILNCNGLHIKNTIYKSSSLSTVLYASEVVELETGVDAFEKEIIEYSISTKPVLVDFMADWCGPCKLTNSIFKDLAKDFDNVKFVKVDTEKHESTVDTYNIQGLPLFALFVNGKIVATHSGAISKEPLRKLVLSNLPKT